MSLHKCMWNTLELQEFRNCFDLLGCCGIFVCVPFLFLLLRTDKVKRKKSKNIKLYKQGWIENFIPVVISIPWKFNFLPCYLRKKLCFPTCLSLDFWEIPSRLWKIARNEKLELGIKFGTERVTQDWILQNSKFFLFLRN